MSMDQSAIREITSQAIAASNATAKALSEGPIGCIPTVALPKDFQIHSLEHLLSERMRMRGKYHTYCISHFADYCPSDEAFPVFVNEESMQAVAVLNFGNNESPGHCDHTATVAMRKTAPFKALLAMNGQTAGQRKLAEWMEDWRHHIICREIEGGPALNIATAIASVRKVTVEATSKKDSAVGSFSSERSDFERLEAKGDALPAFLEFTCEPYQGLPERTFKLRLGVHAEGDVRFSMHIITLELHEQQMASEMAALIQAAMADKQATVLIGTFNT